MISVLSSFPPGLRLALTSLVCVWLAAGCAAASSEVSSGDEAEGPCAGVACARSTPGCAVEDIRRSGAEVCATCLGSASDVDICGVPEVARCESREDAEGRACRFCATASGELLYDACFTDVRSEGVACEPVPSPPPSGVESAVGAPEVDEDVACQTCTDASGRVVSTVCEPAHDACRAVDDGGRVCRECTRDGRVVIYACDEPRLEPRFCELYANAEGRCVDCYDDANDLLFHTCTLTAGAGVACSQAVTTEGVVCDVCTDAAGVTVYKTCSGVQRQLERCALLDFTEQRCVVCLDDVGGIGLTRCQAQGCGDAQCAPPPACTWEQASAGQWCRACPVGSAGEIEVRCVEDTRLVCMLEGPDDGAFDPAPESACITCADPALGDTVYRRCDGVDALPACSRVERDDGRLCEVCSDPRTGEDIYATCDEASCYAVGTFSLVSQATGATLFVEDQPAAATCTACALGEAAGGADSAVRASATCRLGASCGGADLTASDARCAGSVTFTLRPQACMNPWDAPSAQGPLPPGSVDLGLAVLRDALERGAVALLAATSFPPDAASLPGCAGDCTCRRGDRVEVTARAEDAAAVAALYGDFIAPCDAGGCDGGTCRADGACGD